MVLCIFTVVVGMRVWVVEGVMDSALVVVDRLDVMLIVVVMVELVVSLVVLPIVLVVNMLVRVSMVLRGVMTVLVVGCTVVGCVVMGSSTVVSVPMLRVLLVVTMTMTQIHVNFKVRMRVICVVWLLLMLMHLLLEMPFFGVMLLILVVNRLMLIFKRLVNRMLMEVNWLNIVLVIVSMVQFVMGFVIDRVMLITLVVTVVVVHEVLASGDELTISVRWVQLVVGHCPGIMFMGGRVMRHCGHMFMIGVDLFFVRCVVRIVIVVAFDLLLFRQLTAEGVMDIDVLMIDSLVNGVLVQVDWFDIMLVIIMMIKFVVSLVMVPHELLMMAQRMVI